MKISKISWTLTVVGLVMLLATPLFAEEPAGKKIFLDNKCNTCHSIDSQQIKRTLATSKAPDLSNIGSEKDAQWIMQYLEKKVELNGKKHMKAWAGKPEDFKTLADWLATLKK
jgi:mono/diheme cytochrome c family protein